VLGPKKLPKMVNNSVLDIFQVILLYVINKKLLYLVSKTAYFTNSRFTFTVFKKSLNFSDTLTAYP
jgi:hypothetical protein